MTGGVRVLHVDDEAGFAELTATRLERISEDIAVDPVTDARTGLAKLADGDYDCVVSDYDMPGMNGIEFLDAVRERSPEMPFVLFTGEGSEAVASDAISAGVTDYIPKEPGTEQYTLLANRIENAVDRYRAKAQFDAERRRFRLLFEQLSQPAVEVELTGSESLVSQVNPAFESVFGFDADEIVGEPLDDYIVPEDRRSEARAINERVRTEQRAFSEEVTRLTADGERDFLLQNAGYEDGSGGFAVYTDVTERNERERKLEELQRVTRELMQVDDKAEIARIAVDTARDVLGLEWSFVHDVDDGELSPLCLTEAVRESIDFEPSYPRDGGSPQAQLLWEIYEAGETRVYDDIVAETDVEQSSVGSAIVAALGDHGLFLTTTDRTGTFDRDDVWFFEILATSVEAALDGRAYERRLERRTDLFGQAQEIADLGAWEIDFRNDEEWGTDAVAEVLGLPADADTTVEEGIEQFHPEDRSTLREAYEAAVEDGEPFDLELRVVVDGETRWVRVRTRPQAQDGDVVRVRGTLQDVTERTERQRQLERQNDRLDQFASVVSHDLRNPLSVAEGRLQLAREEFDSDHLDAVERSHDRMSELIDQLLTLARQGDEVSDVAPVDLATTARRCWGAVETADARIEVETDRTIRADEPRLRQLFENLFRNAVEHGSTGNRTEADDHDDPGVTVTVGDCEDGFYVADDGPGIPPEERDQVFEPGYSSMADGTGFGLSIVAEIAEAHGWSVRVADDVDGATGARFEFTGVARPE